MRAQLLVMITVLQGCGADEGAGASSDLRSRLTVSLGNEPERVIEATPSVSNTEAQLMVRIADGAYTSLITVPYPPTPGTVSVGTTTSIWVKSGDTPPVLAEEGSISVASSERGFSIIVDNASAASTDFTPRMNVSGSVEGIPR